MNDWFQRYGKVIPLFVGAIVLVIQQALADNSIDSADRILIGLAIVGAVTTYIVPNLTGGVGLFAKGITSSAFAVLTGLTGWLAGGMSSSDWWALLIAAATAAGVMVFPSQKHPVATATHAA
jgi:hypothetical protein